MSGPTKNPALRAARAAMFAFTGALSCGNGMSERTLKTAVPEGMDSENAFQGPAWDVYARPYAYRYVQLTDIYVEHADKHNWVAAEEVEQVRAFYLRLALKCKPPKMSQKFLESL